MSNTWFRLRRGFFLSFFPSDTPHYENVPFEVPEGWVWVTLKEITSTIGDGLHGTPQYNSEGDYFFINGNNLSNRKIVIKNETKRVSVSEYEKYKKPLNRSSILVSINGTIGNIGIYDGEKIMLGKSACYMNMVSPINIQYICIILESQYFLKYAIDSATGSTIKNVPLKAINNFKLPFPPISEQQRIVAEIEQWFALIDQIEQEKSDLQTIIKQTKSKILDLAIHGKLVPQDPNDEPAIELLKRINPDFTPCDNGHYTQLPEGWAACRLEQVADILDNLRKPINSSERDSRIRNRQIDELYPYYGATGQVGLIDDYIINGNYLLLGEDGAPFLDKNAIKAYSISGKSWVNNHAHILSPKIDFEFLQYSLNQIDYSEYVNGSTRLKLTQTDMRSIKIMLPPLAEQKRIKSKIQTLFSQLDLMMESL